MFCLLVKIIQRQSVSKPTQVQIVAIVVISHESRMIKTLFSPLLHHTNSLFGSFLPLFPRDIFLALHMALLSTERASCMYLFIYFGEWSGK